MQRSASLLIVTLLTFALTPTASAQALWMQLPSDADQVSVEAYRPSEPPDGYAYSQLSSLYFLNGRLSLTDRLQATAELPFGHGRILHMPSFAELDVPLPRSGFGLGNPYLGVAWAATGQLDVEVGGRLPIAGYTASTLIGGRGTTTRDAAFHRERVPVHAIARSSHELGRGFSAVLRGGPELVLRTSRGLPYEWAIQYGIQGWYETRPFALGAGFHGRGQAGWSDQEVNATLIGKLGRFRPGLVVRHLVYDSTFDDGYTVVGVTLGLTLPSFR